MKFVFVSFHQEGFDCLKALLEDGIKFEAIFTFTEEKVRALSAGVDFEPLARIHDTPFYRVESIMSDEAIRLLEKIAPDIIFVIGWTEIVRKSVRDLAKYGCIGMHASLIPEYRGGSPVNWAIINGEERAGQTMFWLASKLDKGDLIDQEPVEISIHDTCGTVYKKVAEAGIKMLRRNMSPILEGAAPRLPQSELGKPVYPRRKPEDGLIKWDQSAKKVYDFIRAITHPYPGAFTMINKKKLFLWEAELITEWPTADNLEPGEILAFCPGFGSSSGSAIVKCANGAILLKRVQWEDGVEVDAYSLYQTKQLSEGSSVPLLSEGMKL
jgi:methionyl-tRNA formyltransferase